MKTNGNLNALEVMENENQLHHENTTSCFWNETCSDCIYFKPSTSSCVYSGSEVPTDPDRHKCYDFLSC